MDKSHFFVLGMGAGSLSTFAMLVARGISPRRTEVVAQLSFYFLLGMLFGLTLMLVWLASA